MVPVIKLLQFIVDEQPMGQRGAKAVPRQHINQLMTDIIQILLTESESPEPEDVTNTITLWFTECSPEPDDEDSVSRRAVYAEFSKKLIEYYYNTYNGVDDKLKRMLSSIS